MKIHRAILTAALLAAAFDALATQPAGVANEWAQRLREDATHFHDTLLDSHPGAVDPENPGFRRLLEDGHANALRRAEHTRDVGGYWWAMREFQASFDDGHLMLEATPALPRLPTRWPGFLTRYDGNRQVVATRLETEADLPPPGAELLACDGIDAATLAAGQVGRFRGRWMLESQRADHGGRLFVSTGNPWIETPRECRFRVDGAERDFTLRWRELDDATFATVFARTQSRAQIPTGLHRLDDGSTWISLGTFNADTQAPSHAQLTGVVDALRKDAGAIRQSRIVLDVRGNGGGSSHWSRQIANLLWGEDAVQGVALGSDAVDWRPSTANIANVRKFHDMLLKSENPDPEHLEWARTVLAGLERAQAQGLTLWRQSDDGDDEDAKSATAATRCPANDPPRQVYVLTDSACASACLDALDLWKALGVVQVGRETSADTLYMEIRGEPLPSGMARMGIPTKVYRGRARGSNQPYRPDHVFDGDMADTQALAAWIADIARQRETDRATP